MITPEERQAMRELSEEMRKFTLNGEVLRRKYAQACQVLPRLLDEYEDLEQEYLGRVQLTNQMTGIERRACDLAAERDRLAKRVKLLEEALKNLLHACPEPVQESMGPDQPPEYTSETEHWLAYAIFKAKEVLDGK